MSENSERTKYSRSLFERLADNGFSVHMLTVQYRMHPHIRSFPSKMFYNDLITDDKSVMSRGPLPVLIQNLESSKLFARVNFLDLPKSQESVDETSKTNQDEARYTMALL
jgi:superfamily I DNA and/or RNA helicase